jgi:hypothetical protein
MGNEYHPPRKKPVGIAFGLAGLGLLALNFAAELLMSGKANGFGWSCLLVGVALLMLAVGSWGRNKLETIPADSARAGPRSESASIQVLRGCGNPGLSKHERQPTRGPGAVQGELELYVLIMSPAFKKLDYAASATTE